QVPEEKEGKKRTKGRFILVATAVAAVMAGIFFFQRNSPVLDKSHAKLQVSSTERSEFKYLLLPDSTQVWLNAASTLEFPPEFGNNKREVFLSGEAYFDVRHAEKVPFIIHTGKISTTVLGTAFNIKAYEDLSNVTVSVSRGKVRVNYLEKEVATLAPGQQVKVNNNGSGVPDRRSGIGQVAAWQQGNLMYDDETILDIAADLERMYNVSIKVSDIAVRNMRISTSFSRQTGVEQALQIICSLTDRKMVQRKGEYFIY
ncbi:MAG: FecR domain-containing protein, partial [Chitinophagaceae bacterium]|nr:FecR domain-containing protein [Chitinophagaceae bacterium]